MNTQDLPLGPPSPSDRLVPFDALRIFLTLLVVAHHAVLAYHPYAPPPPDSLSGESLMWTAFPVVDSQHWPGVDLLVGWNDTFLMSLFFLLAGLFTRPSLQRKGATRFLRQRLLRLGVPFLLMAGLLAPLAYYPTYLQTGGNPAPGAFWTEWLSIDGWPAGPAWFLWVLFALCVAAVALTGVTRGWAETLGRWTERLGDSPMKACLVLIVLSGLALLPLGAMVSTMRWDHFGPFWVQTSRSLHYAVYFLAGIGLGAAGLNRGLLAQSGNLARRWWLWLGAASVSFAVAVGAFIAVMASFSNGGPGLGLATFGNFTFVLTCATTSFAAVAFFLRFARRGSKVICFLSVHSYGVYIFHYVWVSWLQFELLNLPLSGAAKGLLVIAGTSVLALSLTALLRKIPGVARVL